MAMDEEDFKEHIRGLVGDNWWRPLPEIIRDEEQEAVIQAALEGLHVFKYQYDAIGRRAIEATLQARAAV